MADAVAVRMFLLKVLLVIVISPFKCFPVSPVDFLSIEYYKGKEMSILFSNFFEKFFGIMGRQEMEINLPPGWVLRIATFCFSGHGWTWKIPRQNF